MKQIIQYQKNGEITVEELPDIKNAAGGVIVQNYFSLISAGTERTSVETAQASMLGKAKSRPDLVKQVIDTMKRDGIIATYEKVMNRLDNYKELGYSSAGIVIESGVDIFKPGDLVACGGAGFASHSELVFVPKNLCVRVPSEVTMEEAAFTTLGAIALQGVRQTEIKLGEKVAVIGLGLLGLITVQLLKAAGCKVIGLDISEKNFTLARECGCDEVVQLNHASEKIVESFTEGHGTDAVILTASTKSNEPIEKAINFARKKSKIVIVGVSGMNLPRAGFYEKELGITISCSYGPGRYDAGYELGGNDYPIGYVRWTEQRNMEAIQQLLSEKKLDFKKLITHTIPIVEGVKAYDLITGKINEPYLGILLSYPKETKKEFIYSQKIIIKATLDESLQIGFIGAGNFAQSNLLPHLIKEKVLLQSVVTRKPINAKSVATKFGFKEFGTDVAQIMNDQQINTVFIASHHDSHARFVVEALLNGKNVFVEKPLAVNEEELTEIQKTYTSNNSNLLVGFNRRFSKPFNRIKQFFADVKEPFVINYRVNAGFIPLESWIQDAGQGGRIIGEVCHFIDIFDFFVHSKPVSLFAASIKSKNNKTKNDDTVSVIISYNDGSIANLQYLANGNKGLAKEYCEIFSGGLTAVMNDFKEIQLMGNGKSKKITFDGKKGHEEEVIHFVNVLRGKENLRLPFESIIQTTTITFKILESLRKNGIVYF